MSWVVVLTEGCVWSALMLGADVFKVKQWFTYRIGFRLVAERP